jgi:hypothetical protein
MTTTRDLDMGLWFIGKTEFMKACGSMIKGIRRVTNVIAMAILTKVIFKRERLMAKGFIIGPMERSMMENGVRGSKMVMECGKEYSEIVTWDNG